MASVHASHEFWCAYFPDFPAWTFRRAGYPRGVPLAVTGTGGEAGTVISCSRSARSAGIEPGITAARAERLCPECVIRTRDVHLEEAAWDEVVSELHGLTPFLEPERPFILSVGAPARSARDLIRRLQIQGGLGPHRTVARLAAVRAAPGNTLRIRPAHVDGFYDRFGVERLIDLGFEEELLELLGLFGYRSIGALRALSKRHLVHQFGDEGRRLHALAHPAEAPPPALFVPPRTVRRTHEWDDPVCEPHETDPVLVRLTEAAAGAMTQETCQRVRVLVRRDGEGVVRARARILIEPTCHPNTLFRIAKRLLPSLLHSPADGPDEVSFIDLLAVELGSLRHFAPCQTTLFRQRPDVARAVGAVHRRFPGQIQRAVLCPDTLFSEEAAGLEPFPESSPVRSLLSG